MKKSFFIAVFILAAAVIWVLTGVMGGSQTSAVDDKIPAQEMLQNTQDQLTEVQVAVLQSQPMKNAVVVTGRTQASRKVNLSAEISGQIAEIKVEKGGVVKKGDIVARLETQDRAARVTEAEQLLNQRQIQFTAAKDLSEKGFNSKVRLAEARAQLESAKAQLKQARVALANINIRAPFNGVINDQFIEVGDFVSSGSQIVSIVDLDPIEITGFLTEKQLIGVEQGIPANIKLLNQMDIQGTVNFVASVADEETRTFKMEVSVPNADHAIKEGLTATMTIPLKEVQAYKISPSILSLADDGSIGVKIVDSEDMARFVSVNLLKDTPQFLWISGLPDEVRLITVGQEFVLDGQKVKPVTSEKVVQP